MNIEELRNYCKSKTGAAESFPFDNETLVFKANGKMFALIGLEHNPLSVNLKCDPEKAIELREKHSSILPGYHMSKKHWNTVIIDGSLSIKLIKELIDHSYQLVIATKKKLKK
ncbi:MAG: MmcQ/YjbR family DNA-binding protein [Bacteroidetes bacterium]|jgi:predicted DNA-binding protein (MmcQ/YjbR family)|nr:MmcQ/YjbR family DNA-binding protein [Bacteroidota bacterium]